MRGFNRRSYHLTSVRFRRSYVPNVPISSFLEDSSLSCNHHPLSCHAWAAQSRGRCMRRAAATARRVPARCPGLSTRQEGGGALWVGPKKKALACCNHAANHCKLAYNPGNCGYIPTCNCTSKRNLKFANQHNRETR